MKSIQTVLCRKMVLENIYFNKTGITLIPPHLGKKNILRNNLSNSDIQKDRLVFSKCSKS